MTDLRIVGLGLWGKPASLERCTHDAIDLALRGYKVILHERDQLEKGVEISRREDGLDLRALGEEGSFYRRVQVFIDRHNNQGGSK